MQAAMMRIPAPAPRQLNGLRLPSRSASTAGSPNMPTPIIELSISAVRLQRPMVRMSPCEFSVNRLCSFASLVRRCRHGRRPHPGDFCEHVGLAADGLKMRMALAAMIVNTVGPEEIAILGEQFYGTFGVFGLPDGLAQNVWIPSPAVYGYEPHPWSHSCFRGR